MKKTLLALAVAALSANAFAVDLDAPANTIQKYANEHIIPAAGLVVNGAEVIVNAGVSVTTQSYIRFDLNNGATFGDSGTTPLAGALTSGTAGWILSAGGAGQSFAIYRPDANVNLDEQLTLSPLVNVVNKNAVGVTFNVYEDLFDAQNKQRSVYSKAGTYLTFADALVVTAVDTDNTKIAINNAGGTSNFTDFKKATPLETALTSLSVSTANDVLLADTGLPATPATLLSAGTWTLEGNLVAAAASSTGLTVATAPVAAFMQPATTLVTERNKATIGIIPAATASTATINYTVTGDIAVPDTYVTASFAPTAIAGFAIQPKEFVNAGVIRRDGSSQEVDLVLNPNAIYKSFIRITNKAGIAGKIVIDVINDNGEARTVSLSEIDGQTTDTLAAGASSTQIGVVDVFNAAQAKGLTLPGNGKLRYVVTGEVPSTEYNVANTAATDTIIPTNDGISVQSYTVSKDFNSFSAWNF